MNLMPKTKRKSHAPSRLTRVVRHWWAIVPRGGWPAFVSPTKATTIRLFMRAIAEVGDTSGFDMAMQRNGNRLVCMKEVPNIERSHGADNDQALPHGGAERTSNANRD